MTTIEELRQLKKQRGPKDSYNIEVAKKMAEMHLVQQKPIREVALSFNVSKSTAHRHINKLLNSF